MWYNSKKFLQPFGRALFKSCYNVIVFNFVKSRIYKAANELVDFADLGYSIHKQTILKALPFPN